ncbi:Cys/Met metabolism PLP-dependent enzyme [Anoxybacillus vitaminiphilus]|uniref:Cys/Met metabolism PLP-dependent enzyme n=1 Tax=Paranoxybacillus vitaminiphilus TaxID=581036 RepID=A0A327YEK2_9BACL|nr:Cys/Met metabolism PLP-dependent enzyme [Anoxybacillus vitaminiphilus]
MTRGRISDTIRANDNPSLHVLGWRCNIAHEAGIPLIIDNTFATSYLCRSIERSADIDKVEWLLGLV